MPVVVEIDKLGQPHSAITGLKNCLYASGVLTLLGSVCRVGDFNMGLSMFGICALGIRCRELVIMLVVFELYSIVPDTTWLSINASASGGCWFSVLCAASLLVTKVALVYFAVRVVVVLPATRNRHGESHAPSFHSLVDESYQHQQPSMLAASHPSLQSSSNAML